MWERLPQEAAPTSASTEIYDAPIEPIYIDINVDFVLVVGLLGQ